MTADVTDEAAIAAVLAAVPDRLDGVVHAAGVAGGGPVHLLDRAEWERVITVKMSRDSPSSARPGDCLRVRSTMQGRREPVRTARPVDKSQLWTTAARFSEGPLPIHGPQEPLVVTNR